VIAPWRSKAQPITVMCPVEPRMVDSLKATLAALPRNGDSALRKTGRTHFGRWVVIERLHAEDNEPGGDELTVPYLLFTSNIDGSRRTYLRDLVKADPQAMHCLWSHCIGYPEGGGDAGLVRYLGRMQIRTNLFFAPYPRASVADVRSAVALRRSFIDFAVEADDMEPEELQRRFGAWYRDQPEKAS
jgi:hypothetical protein